MPSRSSSSNSDIHLTPQDPPSYTLPSDFHTNPSRYELWSIRVPVDFNAANLDGIKLHIDSSVLNEKGAGVAGTGLLSSFKVNGKSHGLSVGHASESSSFRLLTPQTTTTTSNNDDEEEDEKEKNEKKLTIVPHPFDKHLNLTDITGHDLMETDLAPSMEKAPNPSDHGVKLRLAYAHVPQVGGLKRRWKMPGGDVGVGVGVVNKKQKIEEETVKETVQKSRNEKVKVEEEEEEEELKTPLSKKQKKEHKKSHKKSSKKSHKKDKKKEKKK